jgi:hypothetical protein
MTHAHSASARHNVGTVRQRDGHGVLTPAMLVVLGIIAIGACAISLHVTQHAPIVLPDSAAYLSAAHNLGTGKGLTTSFNPATSLYSPDQVATVYGRVPLAQYGPLYPIVLAFLHLLGLSSHAAVTVVGLASLVAFIVFVGMLAARLVDRRLSLVTLLVLACVAAPGITILGRWVNPLALSTFALSDLLFYALVMASLVAIDAWLRSPTLFRATVVAVLIVAAVLTRYAGVSVAAAAACAALGEVGWDRRRRLTGALVMVGAGIVAFFGWDEVNKLAYGATSPRAVVFHPGGGWAPAMLHVAGGWFFPASWSRGFLAWGAAIIIIATVAIAVCAPIRQWVVNDSAATSPVPVRLWRIGGFFLICYAAVLVVTRIWLDASLAIDNRILGPIQTVLYLLITSMLYWAVRSRIHDLRLRLWSAGIAAAAVLLVWAPNLASLSSEVSLVAPVKPGILALPPSRFVVTDDAAGTYLTDGHASIQLPFTHFYTTGQVNPRFHQQLQEIGQMIRQKHGVLVWWPTVAAGVPSENEVQQVADLVVVKQLSNGVLILGSAPGP